MKILTSTSKGGLDDSISPVFGRCPTFTIVEGEPESSEIKNSEVIPNPGFQAGGGAGIAAAQSAIETGAKAVITGNCGPNAMMVLQRAGIEIYTASGSVEKAVKDLLSGNLTPLKTHSVQGHFGMGGGMGRGPGRGRGPGGGRGGGRGGQV